jgi:hypothetical protein
VDCPWLVDLLHRQIDCCSSLPFRLTLFLITNMNVSKWREEQWVFIWRWFVSSELFTYEYIGVSFFITVTCYNKLYAEGWHL